MRFFINEPPADGVFTIGGGDARHITRSLRLKIGAHIKISDSSGFDYECVIVEIKDSSVRAKITDISKNVSEPSVRLTLFQALPKGAKLDLIVEKCVELGVYEITPVLTEFCVTRELNEHKSARLNKIAEAAAKQSGRGSVPKVAPLLPLAQAAERPFDLSLAPYEKETSARLSDALRGFSGKTAAIFIGPEGGFSPKEIELLRRNSAIVTLGRRILRTETAPIVAAALFFNETGDL
ncbi:MAG: 16S rRNA (uracil(1498)-N(3))-methyltransferase [Clostridiales bacterium]|jgi:16S rRNA (uracil1498-N3)-methyltransferase|nr:16S rRNA (uracil(1498)-N(3))-methyltransferase [Clostridiales bacterium]